MKTKWWIILIVLLLPCFCPAQSSGQWQYYYNHNHVTAITAKGDYVWVGYDCGLERRNIITGKTDQYFTYNSGMLFSNIIKTLTVDSSGNLWTANGGVLTNYELDYGPYHGGLIKFNGTNWTDYTSRFANNYFTNVISFVAADRKNNLWIMTIYGFFRYDLIKDTIYHFSTAIGASGPQGTVVSGAFDTMGNSWFATDQNGLFKYDGKNWTSIRLDSINSLTSVAADKKGTIWIGTINKGLARLDSSGLKYYSKSNSGLPDDHITALTIDSAGNLWTGTMRGIARFNGNEWNVYSGTSSGLKDSSITCMTVDSKGNIWAGTFSGGVARLDSTKWITDNTSTSKLKSNHIRRIAADSSDYKWIVTDERELYRFKDTEWVKITKDNSGLPGNFIQDAAVDAKGNKWFIGTTLPLNYITSNYSTFAAKYNDTAWVIFDSSNTDPLIKRFTAVTFDSAGNVWFAIDNGQTNNGSGLNWPANNGLAKYDGKSWKVYLAGDNVPPHSTGYVLSMAAKANGNIFMGNDGGIMRFDGRKWFEFFRGYKGIAGVNGMAVDHKGRLWTAIGDFDGSRMRGQFARFDWYKSTVYNSGCTGPWFWAAAVEKSNTVWGGGRWCGLIRVDGGNDTVYSFFNVSNSGVPDNNVTSISIDRSNQKWIGTQNSGIAVFRYTKSVITDVDKGSNIPRSFTLLQNYPNPFNPVTTISYSIPYASAVSLKVFDILGRECATLEEGYKSAGNYKIKFDASSLPSGIYVYAIKAGEFNAAKKCVILK